MDYIYNCNTFLLFHKKILALMINGRKFIVCDPTYIGAPVGAQMPGLEYDNTQAIVLK